MGAPQLQENFVKCNQDIDSNHVISISKECSCSFQISFRTLINIGLQPAISHIATIIASSLASNSFFGLYTVSALIIMDDSKETLIQNQHHIFEMTMQRCLQAHHRRTIVFYSRETVMAAFASLGSWCTGLQQVFGKGSYSQVSSTDYVLKFLAHGMDDDKKKFTMCKYHSNSFKKADSIEKPSEFVILEKGDALDLGGSFIHVFYRKDFCWSLMQMGKKLQIYIYKRCIEANRENIELCILEKHQDKVYYHTVGYELFYFVNIRHPFTIRVIPQHHSSTIEFELSYVNSFGSSIYPVFKSFSVLERLALK
jgi:hypothetical protein